MFSFSRNSIATLLKTATAIVAATATLLMGSVSAEGVPTTEKVHSSAPTAHRAPTADPDWPNEIYGTVFDDFGDPAVNLQIDAVNSAGTVIDTVWTDDTGFYNFFDLAAATYKLHFVGDADYADEWYEDVSTRAAGTGLAVSNTRGWIADAEVTWVGSGGGGGGGGNGGFSSIEGTVTDADDNAMEGVDVSAFDVDGNSVATSSTDVDGYYLIESLTAGQYTLCFDSVDFPYSCFGGGADALDPSTSWFTLGESETYWQDYQLVNTGVIDGTVTDSSGNTLEGIVVQFFVLTDWASWEYAESVTTDADGYYSADLPEGYYRVAAEPQDSGSTLEPQWYNGVSSMNLAAPIQISSNIPAEGIDFSLAQGSSIGVNTWCGSTGTECRETPYVRLVAMDGTLISGEKTAVGSTVVFTGIPAGDYKVVMNDYWWGGDGTESDALEITVGDDEDIRGITQVFPLNETGANISGTVTVAGGAPAVGHTVELRTNGVLGGAQIQYFSAETDESGYYEFAGVNPGLYTLAFAAPVVCDDVSCNNSGEDYWGGVYNEDFAQYFTATDGVDATFDFQMLPRSSVIAGTVRNAAGTALSGAEVFVSGPNGSGNSVISAANGTYRVEGLPPGLYTAVAFKDGYVNPYRTQTISRASITVANGATGTLNLSLTPGTARISGRVTGSDAPAVGLEDIGLVAVRKSDNCAMSWTSTDESGNYSFADLPAGSYYVAAGVRGGFGCGHSGDGMWNDGPYIGEYLTDKPNMAAATPITVTAVQNLTNQNFVLQLGATISGFVGLTDGSRGYAGLTAAAYGANDEMIGISQVNPDGTFTIPALPAGVYYVKISADDEALSPEWWSDSSGARRAVSVTTAQNVSNLYIELEPAAVLTGVIRSLNGVPLSGRVDAIDSTGAIIASTYQEAEDLRYSIRVPAGIPVRLRATVVGQEFWLGGATTMLASPWVTGNSGGETFVREIITGEPSQISGRVTVGGVAVNSGSVDLLDATGQTVGSGSITGGAYTITGVLPGTYTLLAHLSGGSMVFYGNKDSIAGASYITASGGALLEGIDIDASPVTGMFVPGTISMTGVPKVGTAMSVAIGTWNPAPASVLYRWYVSDPYGQGAWRKAVGMAASYTITNSDLGKYLSLEVTVLKNGFISDEMFIQIGLVSGLALTASPVPTITGGATAKVGTALTAVPGSWTPAPVTVAYQWMKGGEPIPGATASTYTPTAADAGARLTVRTIGTKPGYATVLKESAQTAVVALQTLTAMPVPTITGTARVGSVLTANPGTWAPAPVGLSYQWRRNGTNIPGANAPTYLLTAEDQGRTITVAVVGSKVGFTTSVPKISAATTTVAAPPASTLTTTPTPTITGTAAIDETLTVTTGTWGPAPVTLAIQWMRNGVPILGANATTYRLTAADVDATIRVAVKGTKTGYFAVTKVSAATTAVAGGIIDPDEIAYATIVGTGTIGSPLEVELFDVYPDDVYITYQWLRDGVPIRGAKRATYVPTARDELKDISVILMLAKPGYGQTEIWSDSVVASY